MLSTVFFYSSAFLKRLRSNTSLYTSCIRFLYETDFQIDRMLAQCQILFNLRGHQLQVVLLELEPSCEGVDRLRSGIADKVRKTCNDLFEYLRESVRLWSVGCKATMRCGFNTSSERAEKDALTPVSRMWVYDSA